MTKLVLLILLGLAAAFYFPDSRAMLTEKLGPAMDPVFRWQTKGEMDQIARDLQNHERENYGQLPTRRQWLGWLQSKYTTETGMKDAWGQVYTLRIERDSFAIISNGPDRIISTDDDVTVKRKLARPDRY